MALDGVGPGDPGALGGGPDLAADGTGRNDRTGNYLGLQLGGEVVADRDNTAAGGLGLCGPDLDGAVLQSSIPTSALRCLANSAMAIMPRAASLDGGEREW